ncbi:MAG: hypothetical protein E3J72_00465 [Planctomycetota bacterium]|nr:MAG: hypothetical protein E3J72_00465 [Planctomycetota bacterium]
MVGGTTPTENNSVNDDIALVFDPGADAVAGTLTATERMNVPRKSCTCIELNGGAQVLAICGTDENKTLLAMCEIYTTATNSWANAALVNVPRSGYGFAVLQDGRCAIFGGSDADKNVLDSIEIYDPAADAWTLLKYPMHYARTSLRACLLADGSVLIFGGKDAGGFTVAASEIYTP